MAKKKAPTFEMLQHEYTHLLQTMEVKPSWRTTFRSIASKLSADKKRYQAVSDRLGGRIPWEFIAAIHNLESGADFTKHLHNGDPLTARTRRVPRGYPKHGTPPFTWEESAEDALRIKGFDRIMDWSDERVCYELERYNGWGYRLYHSNVLSPYLWSGTTHYTRGKYVEDGKWSASAVSRQTGAMPLYLELRKSRKDLKKEVKENSTKVGFIRRFKVWLTGLFGTYTLADYFNVATEYMSKLKQFAFDNKYLLMIGAGAAVLLVLKFLEDKTVKDYEEGRYVPSKIMKEED